MLKLNNLTTLAFMGLAFYAGRKSVDENKGVMKGYSQALITMHLYGRLTVEEVNTFMREAEKVNG